MFALRERRIHVTQEDFELAVAKVMKKDTASASTPMAASTMVSGVTDKSMAEALIPLATTCLLNVASGMKMNY